ncbi:MAG: hypothetical protein K9G11_04575 [Rickettsiaceae bacterium]|nr:hypothetical protein [Rickettsiaceae bacterium]
MIQLLTSFFLSIYLEESVALDCHGANASRNDATTLPLGDFATLLTDPSFQQIRTHPHKFILYLHTNFFPISLHSNIPLQIHSNQPTNLSPCLRAQPIVEYICRRVGCPGLPWTR